VVVAVEIPTDRKWSVGGACHRVEVGDLSALGEPISSVPSWRRLDEW